METPTNKLQQLLQLIETSESSYRQAKMLLETIPEPATNLSKGDKVYIGKGFSAQEATIVRLEDELALIYQQKGGEEKVVKWDMLNKTWEEPMFISQEEAILYSTLSKMTTDIVNMAANNNVLLLNVRRLIQNS